MRKWFKHADGDDIKMVLSGCIAVMAFCALVLVWFLETLGAGMRRELQHRVLLR